jgi:hypothetical protein
MTNPNGNKHFLKNLGRFPPKHVKGASKRGGRMDNGS